MLLASHSIGSGVNNDRPSTHLVEGGQVRSIEAKDYQPHSCCQPAILTDIPNNKVIPSNCRTRFWI